MNSQDISLLYPIITSVIQIGMTGSTYIRSIKCLSLQNHWANYYSQKMVQLMYLMVNKMLSTELRSKGTYYPL